jgi:DNA-binding GntR family transcriptional regulator
MPKTPSFVPVALRSVAESLHSEVAAQLREKIFSGELAPSSFVDELALKAWCGKSRGAAALSMKSLKKTSMKFFL